MEQRQLLFKRYLLLLQSVNFLFILTQLCNLHTKQASCDINFWQYPQIKNSYRQCLARLQTSGTHYVKQMITLLQTLKKHDKDIPIWHRLTNNHWTALSLCIWCDYEILAAKFEVLMAVSLKGQHCCMGRILQSEAALYDKCCKCLHTTHSFVNVCYLTPSFSLKYRSSSGHCTRIWMRTETKYSAARDLSLRIKNRSTVNRKRHKDILRAV